MRTRRLKLTSLALMTGIAATGVITSGTFDRVDAVTINLYDGSSGATPSNYTSNPYLAFSSFSNMGGGGTQSANSGGLTTLDTNLPGYAGYSNYNTALNTTNGAVTFNGFRNSAFPILDSIAGYTLSFTVKLNNSQTNNPYRAGFSALVVGNDRKGIEIGFRNPTTPNGVADIFSQNDLNRTSPLTNPNSIGERNVNLGGILSNFTTYNLNVSGDNYTLTTGANTILSGLLRDYKNASTPGSDVYRTPNLIFLGDNTNFASASVGIQNMTLVTNAGIQTGSPNINAAAVPEPSNTIGASIALFLGTILKRNLSKNKKEDLYLSK